LLEAIVVDGANFLWATHMVGYKGFAEVADLAKKFRQSFKLRSRPASFNHQSHSFVTTTLRSA